MTKNRITSSKIEEQMLRAGDCIRMIIYKDIVSDDELISDSFKMELVDDIVYEVNCKMVPEGGVKVDIGANPSAEGEDAEEVDDSVVMVNNVVNAFRLQETSFDKKSYIGYIKEYMKRLKKHLQDTNPERVETFEKSAQNFVKKVLEKFTDYQFFQGDSFNAEAMVVLMGYREDGITPYLIYFKDGLKGMKV